MDAMIPKLADPEPRPDAPAVDEDDEDAEAARIRAELAADPLAVKNNSAGRK